MKGTASESDSPWKEALESFLDPFLAFFFADLHKAVDWSKGYVSLDKELHQIVRDADIGRRLADKLFRVSGLDGREIWLYIHIEVQGQRDESFAQRMFVYHYRIYDRYHSPVVSLAVLCDADRDWKPEHFGYNRYGCEVLLRFPVVKLLDYQGRDEVLEHDGNPFAAVVLAQLKALETRKAPAERGAWKLRLIKQLHERGLSAEQIRQLFRLIDWMLVLPEELERQFRVELSLFEEERHMPYLSSIERLAKEEGREEGREQGRAEGRAEGREEGLRQGLFEAIKLDLQGRFGERHKRLLADVRAVKEIGSLRKLVRSLKDAQTLDDVRRVVRQAKS